MHEVISKMRKWAQNRAVVASSKMPEPPDEWKNDNIPKLKQESYANPFLKSREK
jgi:hypothetical protein